MIKTQPPSATGGNGTSGGNNGGSNLRSASPHRNAYEAGLAALKKATDHLNNAANGTPNPGSRPPLLPRPTGRGQRYGSNVHRIKNMFMQMQSPGDEEDGGKMLGEEPSKVYFERVFFKTVFDRFFIIGRKGRGTETIYSKSLQPQRERQPQRSAQTWGYSLRESQQV